MKIRQALMNRVGAALLMRVAPFLFGATGGSLIPIGVDRDEDGFSLAKHVLKVVRFHFG